MPEHQPTCFDCTHPRKYPGSCGGRCDPPEPASAECALNDQTMSLQEEYVEEAAQHCPFFNPEMIAHCANCQTTMHVPAWSHLLWGSEWYSGEPAAVCSATCLTGYKQKQQGKCEEKERFYRKTEAFMNDPNRTIPPPSGMSDAAWCEQEH